MEPQLYMYSGMRGSLIDRHEFFVRETKARVFKQFEDLDGEAKRLADEVYSQIGSRYPEGHEDSAADFALNHGLERWEMLYDLKTDIELAAVGAMYHRWDKELRFFIQTELHHAVAPDAASSIAWDQNAIAAFNVLKDFGWDCSAEPFYATIRDCRLIVNVYKHGDGRSFQDVVRLCPQYLKDEFGNVAAAHATYRDLKITTAEFDEFAGAFHMFWKSFPERLFLRSNDAGTTG